MSMRTTLTATVLFAGLAIGACNAPAAPASPASPGGGASPTSAPASPSSEGIAHPTGADEIVLRLDEGGGMMIPEFFAGHVPPFTLYGDGTVVFASTDPNNVPEPNAPWVGQPLRTAKLTEAQIQDLLLFALRDGGLANAREQYDNPMVADAGSTIFEIHADGDSKTVTVPALGMEEEPGPDTAVKAALAGLADRLRDFDQGGTLASDPYVAKAYRGVLLAQPGVQGVNLRAWPWPDLKPADFKLPADPNVLQQATRSLSPAEAQAIGVEGYENGIQGGVWFQVGDAIYSLALRPLLPGEAA